MEPNGGGFKAREQSALTFLLRAGGFDRFFERKVAVHLRFAPVAPPVAGAVLIGISAKLRLGLLGIPKDRKDAGQIRRAW
jgi:hypothetical protein